METSQALRRPAASNDFYGELIARGPQIEARFRELTPTSGRLFKKAHAVFPGGYTRDALIRDPYAPFIAHGSGALLQDVDGREVTDFWFNATSLPLGHADPRVLEAISKQLPKGTAFFGPTEHEMALAETIIERLPSAEHVRFANSGSEAVMMGVRFARAATGRPLIIKFEGSYHGSYDDVSWSVTPSPAVAGEPLRPTAIPESAGLAASSDRLAVLPFDDAETLEAFVAEHHASVAAILIEPLANKIGLVFPSMRFLQTARDLCDRYGIVLFFDEVIAFRVGYHGAQGQLGVTPDITTLGKVIGGGFPVGAVAGKSAILGLSDQRPGRVTHAGTFNANPITAVAGLTTLNALTEDAFAQINAAGEQLRGRLRAVTDGLPLQVTGEGSLFKITPTASTIRNYRDAATTNKRWESLLSLALYNEGYMLTPALQGCISTVTTEAHMDGFVDAVSRTLAL